MHFDVDKETILLVKHGSHSYGTNVPTSDLDIKGVCIPPMEHTIGFAYNFEQQEAMANKGHEADKVVYSLRKFMKLAADCNPNIIEVLFTDNSDFLKSTVVGDHLVKHRDKFISKKAKHTFSGYAHAQLKRINAKRRWITDPPSKQPVRESYGKINKFDKLEDPAKEKKYKQDLKTWNQYQNWLTCRNPERFEWEKTYGYDVKHGMHLLRLMRMCKEILSGDGVQVKRKDAEFLLSIREGKVPYKDLIAEVEELEKECESLYISSSLPKVPPIDELNSLCVTLQTMHWGLL